MRAARNATTPITGARQDRRFWPRDTRGLLELCEQGYALQQGMKTHCQETADILENLQDSCEMTVNTFLEQMQNTLSMIQQQFEKPANVDWTPVFEHLEEKMQPKILRETSAHQLTIERLESQMDVR